MNVTFLSLNFHKINENSKRLCVFISKKHTKKRVRILWYRYMVMFQMKGTHKFNEK